MWFQMHLILPVVSVTLLQQRKRLNTNQNHLTVMQQKAGLFGELVQLTTIHKVICIICPEWI